VLVITLIPEEIPTQTPEATPTLNRFPIWVSPAIPFDLRKPIEDIIQAEGSLYEIVDEPMQAKLRVEPDADVPLTTWFYAFVSPFPTIQDGGSLDGLKHVWEGDERSTTRMLASTSTVLALDKVLGQPSEHGVQAIPEDAILNQAWDLSPAFAIVPFESLEPRWKVLEVDGASPIQVGFDEAQYPLKVTFGLSGDPSVLGAIEPLINWPGTNRDPNRLTSIVMTGTTALTRTTASRMDRYGATYPGAMIEHWLRDADIAHISNEVSFTEDCPSPDPFQETLRFCSAPRHIALLEAIGVDVIELTGNHVMDWGPEAFLYSLDLYSGRGWGIFGGGKDLEGALKPAIFEHNGNRLAFLGCNAAGPSDVWASTSVPGAASCSSEELYLEVERLTSEGYVVIFTFQWAEGAVIVPAQERAFKNAIDAGARIVSGSQAHRPLGFEFYNDGFIHYGLGNLFFDQMQALHFRQEFIDRHVIYDGRHISTELLTAMLEDYAQPRPMTPEEREALLSDIFAKSRW
jgi:poly-gamma-glutamate synthesis protein (capsule biosynthesis protein)